MRFRHASAGGAADLNRFAFLIVRDAAADVEDNIAQSGSHRDFHQSGPSHHAGKRKYFGAFAPLGTHRRIPLGAAIQNHRQVGQRLDVVDDSRLAEQPLNRREWRPGRGMPRLPSIE